MYDIAIVGLGATGVSLLSQIQDELYKVCTVKSRIAVFNPSCSFAKGKAFGDTDIMHKMNTLPAMMAMTPTEPEQFANFLNSSFDKPERWPSRLKFSGFINQTYQDVKQAGILHLDERQHSIISITRRLTGFELKDDKGIVFYASKVVLCLGSLAADMFPNFKYHPGFITHYSQFEKVKVKQLLIAGSGLTAIDAFRYARRKSNLHIHMYSRHGYIPTCMTARSTYTPIHLTWRNIIAASTGTEDVFSVFSRLLRKEFCLLGERAEFRMAMKLLRENRQTDYLRFLLTRAEKGFLPWQDILVSTRPYMHKLWIAFTLKQKQRFMKVYGAVWAAWRHPVPQDVFSELLQASAEGKLTFHQASASPELKGDTFRLQSKAQTVSFTHLWDATGGQLHLDTMKHPLLQSLLKQRLIEPHPCGGINIDPVTFQCKVQSRNVTGIYNIGPLSKGSLFSTNAFWFNARCAEIWAKRWAVEFIEHAVKENS